MIDRQLETRFESLPLYKMPFGAIQAAFVVIGTNYHETFGMIQSNEKKPYQFAALRNRDGDLKKEWYVEWYVWHSPTEELSERMLEYNFVSKLNSSTG
ncbi:hypothetical protein Dfri01_48150 [Dyadobacter frigoris]|nr:hypothetical protein Dfri01_48150 [Dyadobacter frigoris]